MRGRELLAFVGELYGLRGAELRARIDEMLTLAGLTEAAGRRIGGYSGGMRQRLGLAQALLHRPDVLFLDEPASALDPAGRHEILEIIGRLRGQATVFLSTHILSDVERVCDRVAIVDRGRLVVASTVEELQARYAQPIFELELEPGQDSQQLVDELRAAAWAGEVTHAGDGVRVVARDPGAASREILPLVARLGVRLARFERGRPSLEDIFLRLVGSRDAGSQPATAQEKVRVG
jgi:ABC-2 type transport system ATP-binding protein